MLSLAAAVRGESVQMAVLAACCFAGARLLLAPPERRVPVGAPYGTSLLATLLAASWVLMVMTPPSLIDSIMQALGQSPPPAPAPRPAFEITPQVLVIVVLEKAMVISLLGLALALPRALAVPPDSRRPTSPEGPDRLPADELAAAPAAAYRDSEIVIPRTPVPPSPPVERDRGSAAAALAPTTWKREASLGVLIGLASVLLTLAMAAALQSAGRKHELHPFLDVVQQSADWWVVAGTVLTACALAPLQEELLFRVILQGWLTDRLGRWMIPCVATGFALVHGLNNAPLLLPLAFLLGWLYDARRSYVGIVAAHAAFNGVNVIMAMALSQLR
ncbi:MAG: CPBP family intramembrane metalloprotease [Planctomyces sp.]|nr:CPBP family intramembrane metalloprotease [Planctomyces sp.]